jgi:formate hydrogenlyase transcriptional activator
VGPSLPIGNSPAGQAFLAMETKIFNYEDLLNLNDAGATQLLIERGVRSVCCAPMITNKGPLGTLNLGSHQDLAFKQPDTGLLKLIAGQLAVAIENRRVHCEVAQLKDKLAAEKRFLEGEIHSTLNFEEMIGESPFLTEVLRNTKTVASSDATVLILGETGTGKELLARAIHRMSPRKDGNFIKLNCAAIPTGLLESERFGHEKGAFTGAISQKIGRLELADKGTLLLDEVGDIPLQLQPKLLRVLQDREFERLGSTRTIRVDIRLIAATNRDLAARVEEREFRSDLYYRINVSPIRMPALRERKTDMPLLVRYFVEKFSKKMNKEIERVSTETMDALGACEWQGNIRELENY